MSTDLIKGGTIAGAVQGIHSGRSVSSSGEVTVTSIAVAIANEVLVKNAALSVPIADADSGAMFEIFQSCSAGIIFALGISSVTAGDYAAIATAILRSAQLMIAAMPSISSGDSRPKLGVDSVTGNVNITSASPVTFPRQDLGSPLGNWTFPAQRPGTKIKLAILGSMNNAGSDPLGGPGDQVRIMPVVNGVQLTGTVASAFLNGGQPVDVTGQWEAPLSSTTPNTVTFNVWSESGNKVGCCPFDPGGPLDYLKTAIQASYIIGQ